jgi:hypothetical protein
MWNMSDGTYWLVDVYELVDAYGLAFIA